MKIFVIVICCTALFILGCGQSSQTSGNYLHQDSLSYEMIVQSQSFQDCEPGDTNCTYIRFEYPAFTNAHSPLNDSITLLTHLFFANKEKNIFSKDSAMIDFIELYAIFRAQYPEAKAAWEVDKSISVLNQNPKWITLQFTENSYEGGAHPNHNTQYLIIEKLSGKRLRLTDFFDTVAINKLTILGEPLFCAAKGIAPEQGLDEAGYWFPDNHFTLNENFYFSEQGLTFYYNTYEVGPYVAGSTEITIPASKIVKLIKK